MIFLEILKKPIRFFIDKYWRIIYKYNYDIPFFDSSNKSKIVNPIEYLTGVKSVAIIGKGASIFENNPKNIIEECDFKVLLNRVDVENLEEYLGNSFDAQISSQVAKRNSIMPVLSKELISKYGIDLIICNLGKDDDRFNTYCNFFQNRVQNMSYMPKSCEMDFDIDIYQYSPRGSLTIASSILRILYNVPTVEKIVLAGVDAYHFGYSHKEQEDGKVFHNLNITTSNPKETHGKPLLKYIFDSIIEINKFRKIDIYFPLILKGHIDFPCHDSFKFYK